MPKNFKVTNFILQQVVQLAIISLYLYLWGLQEINLSSFLSKNILLRISSDIRKLKILTKVISSLKLNIQQSQTE